MPVNQLRPRRWFSTERDNSGVSSLVVSVCCCKCFSQRFVQGFGDLLREFFDAIWQQDCSWVWQIYSFAKFEERPHTDFVSGFCLIFGKREGLGGMCCRLREKQPH